jgi:hypothetical protein
MTFQLKVITAPSMGLFEILRSKATVGIITAVEEVGNGQLRIKNYLP